MAPKLIVMLTYNDRTIENAMEIFEECKDAPVEYWGFKDIGIKLEEMRKLVNEMKKARKITFLEPLRETEEECLDSAKAALECKFDYVVGAIYHGSVSKLLRSTTIKYIPTCGKRSGIPRVLEGSIEEIIADGRRLEKAGVDGLSLSVFRYKGNPEELAERFLKEIEIPIMFSGSINNYNRLGFVKKMNPWAFTIGSAFFNNEFGKDLSIKDQINEVLEYLEQ